MISTYFESIRPLLFKFIFSSFGILAGFIANIFVANHVGPTNYGQYGFIISACTFIVQIVLVTLNETYIFHLSVKRYSLKEINTAYLGLMLVVFAICIFIFTGTLFTTRIKDFFWPGVDKISYLIAGFIYVLFLNLQQGLVKYGDCTQQYVKVEGLRLTSKLIALGLIILLWSMNYLNLATCFDSLLFSSLFFFGIFFLKYPYPISLAKTKNLNLIIKDLYQGWNPLAFYPVIDALYIFGGRYILQIVAGTQQQGFYTYALFLALVPIGIVSPMTTIYMSHMSKLYQENRQLLKIHFLKILQIAVLMYGIFSFFFITNAAQIVYYLSGNLYQEAVIPLQWLAFYSFLNIFDLLGGNLYFCTERTKVYRLIVNFTYLIGIGFLAYFYLWGQVLAVNFAIMLTLIYTLQIVIQLWGNIRFLKMTSYEVFSTIVAPIVLLSASGFGINALVENLWGRMGLYFCGLLLVVFITYKKQKTHLVQAF